MVCVFTTIRLEYIFGLIGCGVVGFVCGLTWHALAASTIRDHADNVLGDSFS